MSELLDLSYRVELDTPLHCGTGFARGILDRAVARNGLGDLYIPGSTIKGRLRHAAELLALPLHLRTCLAPRPEMMCRGASLCDVCLLFGSPAQGEQLFFDDCRLLEELRQRIFGEQDFRGRYRARHQTWERTQVMLDRRRRVSAEGHLFSSEVGVSDLIFAGRITGRLPPMLSAPDTSPVALLVAALLFVESLGSGRSRGAGHCRLERIIIDGTSRDLVSLLDIARRA